MRFDPITSFVPITYCVSKKVTPVLLDIGEAELARSNSPRAGKGRSGEAFEYTEKLRKESKRFKSLPLNVRDMITRFNGDTNSLSRDEILKAAEKSLQKERRKPKSILTHT